MCSPIGLLSFLISCIDLLHYTLILPVEKKKKGLLRQAGMKDQRVSLFMTLRTTLESNLTTLRS